MQVNWDKRWELKYEGKLRFKHHSVILSETYSNLSSASISPLTSSPSLSSNSFICSWRSRFSFWVFFVWKWLRSLAQCRCKFRNRWRDFFVFGKLFQMDGLEFPLNKTSNFCLCIWEWVRHIWKNLCWKTKFYLKCLCLSAWQF